MTRLDRSNLINKSLYNSEKNKAIIEEYINSDKNNQTTTNDKELIKSSTSFIEKIIQYIPEEFSSFILCNNDGQIIYISTNIKKNALLRLGVLLNEISVGTNAVAIALKEDLEIEVNGKEHFSKYLKKCTTCAAPIHSEEGDIIGCLALLTSIESKYPYMLPLVIATAKAIEDNIKHKKVSKQLISNTYYTFAIMNSLKFGVTAVNLEGEIHYANDFACQILNIRRKQLLKLNINNVLENWKDIHKQIADNNLVLNEEISFHIKKKKEKFNLSVFPIYDKNNKLIGMVNSIREMNKVYGLINKYTGSNARYVFDDIIAQSKEMKNIISFAKKVSNSPSTILLEGESGTGKEVLAQSIHNYSSRKENGFVVINCAAIPDTLIESELFGYDEDTSTIAKTGGQPSKFELANGGTLFLDEISELKLDMQVKLLRAIQENAITRVRSNKKIPINARIIAATNKDLEAEINSNNFRLDLYYRLNIIPITLPPLRERKEDIPSLIKHFLNKKALLLKKTKPNIKYRTLQELLEYNWPGNIKELENHIEKIVNFNGEYHLIKTKENINYKESINEDITFTLEEIEKRAIIRTLKLMNGNISQTAKKLDIGRNTLYLKLKKYGIVS